jgi:hypothetical protein
MSWLSPIWLQMSANGGLDSLGFPWILSSESRLFNGLRGINRAKVFLDASSLESGAGTAIPAVDGAEGQDCSSGKLISFSDFPQLVVF